MSSSLYHSVPLCPVTQSTPETPGSSARGFPRQECWSGVPFPPPGDLPHPGMEPGSPALQVGSSPAEPPGTPRWEINQEFGISRQTPPHIKQINPEFLPRSFIQYLVIMSNVKESEAKSNHIRLKKIIKIKYKRASQVGKEGKGEFLH